MFLFQYRAFLVILYQLKLTQIFLIIFFKKYKIYRLFWYQIYQNRIKTKETMLFLFFYVFLDYFHKKNILRQKKITRKKKKKSLKPYFLSDFNKIGTKMFCKSYIFEKKKKKKKKLWVSKKKKKERKLKKKRVIKQLNRINFSFICDTLLVLRWLTTCVR